MKLKAILFASFVFICSIAMAEMTIFLKDGTSIAVTKIVFRENVADLFLLNGSVRTVPAEKIDLKASGIPKAQGSYGQAGISTNAKEKRTATPPTIGDAKQRQTLLAEQWEKAEQSAVALKTLGAIRQGDTVKIANRSATGETPTTAYEAFDEAEDWVNNGGFVEEDQPYLVIYKAADGTYGKKLFDSSTFHSNFSVNEKSSGPPEPPPVYIPEKEIKTTPPPTEQPVKTDPPPSIEPTIEEEPVVKDKEVEKPKVSSGSFPITPVVIGLGGIALAGGALFVYSRKRKKPFINTTHFKQFENELRDFEIEIWLKHGRTMDQLIEICLKKFYQEQPAAITAALKIQKSMDRLSVVQGIIRQSGLDSKTAEDVYSEMFHRINWIRETIKQVSEKIGKQPLAQGQPQSTPVLSQPQNTAAPITKSPAATPRPAPTSHADPISKQSQVVSGLPVYLRNVLNELGDLSD
jgi:LPXTG-motif cell wall-anchored protein